MVKKKAQVEALDQDNGILSTLQMDIEDLESKLGDKKETPDFQEEPEEREEKPDAVVDDPVSEDVGEEDAGPDEVEIPTDPKARNDFYAKQRAREKESQNEVKSLKDQLAAITAYLQGQQSVQPRAQPQPQVNNDPEPDKILDREDWLEWDNRQTKREAKETKDLLISQSLQTQLVQARQEFRDIEDSFAKEKPDYMEAKQYLRQTEESALKIMYPNATSAQIKSHIDSEELRLAAQAVQGGRNPADVFYTIAQSRGYAGKKAEASNGILRKDSNFDAIAKNKRKSANIIDSSPAGKVGTPSPEAVVNAAFADLLNLPDSEWAKIEREAYE